MSRTMRTRGFRILVVDDSPAVCRFVGLAVGSDAVHVAGAHDSHTALAIISDNHLDLALVATAFAAPVGGDLLAVLAARGVPVVLVTGSLDQTGVDTEAATGGLIAKPLQVEPLRDLVANFRSSSPVAAEYYDPIEAWLGEADEQLGFIRKHRRGRDVDVQTMDKFERDVSSLRRQPDRKRLEMRPSQVA